MVEKQTEMSEEGSAVRDVTDCALCVKGREAETSQWLAQQGVSTVYMAFGCVWLPRGCLLPLVALDPGSPVFCSLSALLRKSEDQVIPSCVPMPCTAKAADPWALISRWVAFWPAETRKWATLLNRECVLMTKRWGCSVLAQEPCKEGQLSAQAGRQSQLGRSSAKAVGSLPSRLEQPLCCCSVTAAPKHCSCPSTGK